MQVWAEPVPEAPEPQGCAATLEQEAVVGQAMSPASTSAQGATSGALAAHSPQHAELAPAAPAQLLQASAEQGQQTKEAPSQLGNSSHTAHHLSEAGLLADAAEDATPPHPLLSIAPASSIESEAPSSNSFLHPLLQVSSLSTPVNTSGRVDIPGPVFPRTIL